MKMNFQNTYRQVRYLHLFSKEGQPELGQILKYTYYLQVPTYLGGHKQVFVGRYLYLRLFQNFQALTHTHGVDPPMHKLCRSVIPGRYPTYLQNIGIKYLPIIINCSYNSPKNRHLEHLTHRARDGTYGLSECLKIRACMNGSVGHSRLFQFGLCGVRQT